MQRGKNFTLENKHKLLDFIFRNIIENKEIDKVSKLQKEKAWININFNFNLLLSQDFLLISPLSNKYYKI